MIAYKSYTQKELIKMTPAQAVNKYKAVLRSRIEQIAHYRFETSAEIEREIDRLQQVAINGSWLGKWCLKGTSLIYQTAIRDSEGAFDGFIDKTFELTLKDLRRFDLVFTSAKSYFC
jgi:hypothetical protein